MDPRDYFMNELWPLLNDEQRWNLIEFAAFLALHAPPQEPGNETEDEPDSNDTDD